MIIEVFHSSNVSRDFWISISVLLSNAEVASSRIRISGLRKKILAIFNLCFSHQLSFKPLSQIIVSSHFSDENTKFAFALWRAVSISSLLASTLANCIFSRILVLNKVLSCITIPICFLKDCFVIFLASIQSIFIVHPFISKSLRSNFAIVVLPLQVLQTSAIFSPGFIVKFIFFITSSSLHLYMKLTSLNSIFHIIFSISFDFSNSESCSILSNSSYIFLAHSRFFWIFCNCPKIAPSG